MSLWDNCVPAGEVRQEATLESRGLHGWKACLLGKISCASFFERSSKSNSSFSRLTGPTSWSCPMLSPTPQPCPPSHLDHVTLCRDFCLQQSQENHSCSSHNNNKPRYSEQILVKPWSYLHKCFSVDAWETQWYNRLGDAACNLHTCPCKTWAYRKEGLGDKTFWQLMPGTRCSGVAVEFLVTWGYNPGIGESGNHTVCQSQWAAGVCWTPQQCRLTSILTQHCLLLNLLPLSGLHHFGSWGLHAC